MDINIGEKKVIKVDAAKKEIIRILFIILLLAVVFIFLRLVLKLFGANPETVFVGFIYLVSGFFMLPFFGIFPQYNDVLPGRATVDVVAIIALFCYLILISISDGHYVYRSKYYQNREKS